MKKTIDIKELQTNHPEQYQKEYERYCTAEWEMELETDWYKEGLKEYHKWLSVDNIYYSISYSQGDYAYFTGRVHLEKFLDEFDTDNEYFVLREAMRMGDCEDWLDITQSPRWGVNAVFDNIEWMGEWASDEEDVVVTPYGRIRSILEGMNYLEYYEICGNLIGDLETWVKTKCEQMFGKLYDDMCSEIEYQQSEEAFVEWALSMDEQFEVEVGDEPEGTESDYQGARLAA